jgi:hypothetical protein
MVAPAGVNEGTPQEPAGAGSAPVELAEAEPAQAERAQAVQAEAAPADDVRTEAEPAAAVPAGTVPAEVVAANVVAAGVVPAPAEVVAANVVAAGVVPAPAQPADAERPPAGPAEAGGASALLAGALLAGAGPVETELAEADEAGWDAAEERRDVSPLAVAGIILGVIALVGVAVGVLAVVTHGFRPKTVITYRPAAVFGLRAGQCVDSSANALSVTVLSCARPHDAEVFATFSLPATAWPGASAVQQDASNGCANRFGSYVDPQLATVSLTQEYVYPNKAAWQAGERTVVCEVSAVSGQLTGSVRAKG